MSATGLIVFGILTWIMVSVPLAIFLAQVNRLSRTQASVVKASLATQVKNPVHPSTMDARPVVSSTAEAIAGFPVKPTRFAGRDEAMAAASSTFTATSGCTAVVFHGMAGAGKTTCAVQLAYRHHQAFAAVAFWSAPTDPRQFGEALHRLAVVLDAQLEDHGFLVIEEISTVERLQNFLPTLTAVFANANLLLVLDNLETLLTPDGQWRDPRWAPLIGALTDHSGPSRVILASRIVPTVLNPSTVWIQPLRMLTLKESEWLVSELPNLRALLMQSVALGHRVLTLAQGHPQLLELANAAAADPPRLAYQLAEIEAGVSETTLSAFLTQGHTKLDGTQLLHIVNTWTITVAATLPASARLLLQALCRMEETDRNTTVLDANWPVLWRRLGQPGEPPPLAYGTTSLIAAALILTDPADDRADQNEPARYRIHPGVVEVVQATTPDPVIAAIDEQLAAWWTTVAEGWRVEQQQADNDTNQLLRGVLAAARYLLRQHAYNAASCLLERTLIRYSYSLTTSLATIPLLRRVAEATNAVKDLLVLGAAIRRVDLGEAETLLSRAYDQAVANSEYPLASTAAGELVALLRDQGRLRDALTMAEDKIAHTRRAGFGYWTQLSDQGRRLQILYLLGHHERVLLEVPALRSLMADLPGQHAHNDRVDPWNVREGVLDIGRLSAVALERWYEALDLNEEIIRTRRQRGVSPVEIARTWFNDYVPLLRLGRLTDLDQLLCDCCDVFDAAGDLAQLAAAFGARADVEAHRDRPLEAIDFQRIALRLWYSCRDPGEISSAHHNLANYLSRAAGKPREQRAHRLIALLINHLTGNTRAQAETLAVLASELREETNGRDAPTLPRTLSEVVRLVDTNDGIRFHTLLVTLCPEPVSAEHVLASLLTIAASFADQSCGQ